MPRPVPCFNRTDSTAMVEIDLMSQSWEVMGDLLETIALILGRVTVAQTKMVILEVMRAGWIMDLF